MRQLFDVPENVKTKLWRRYSANRLDRLNTLEQTLYETGFLDNQLLILEKQVDGKWLGSGQMRANVNWELFLM